MGRTPLRSLGRYNAGDRTRADGSVAELSGYRTVSRSIGETMAIGVSLTSKNGSLWPRTALKFNSLLVLKCLPGRHFCSWVFVIVVQSLSPVQLCNPVDCSMSSFPVLHYLPEFVQMMSRVGHAI